MPAHRLPLYRVAPEADLELPDVPRVAPGSAIAVIDASTDGAPSLTFSAALCRSVAQHGGSLGVALMSFAEAPALSSAVRERFDAGQSLCALSARASDQALRARLASERSWLLVGPAALAFAVPLVIMVGADVPMLRWPDALRAQRERISLLLSGDGLPVAQALGRLLAAR